MGEEISVPESAVEKKKKIYPSVSSFLSAFEESSQFDEALVERENELKFEHPDMVLDRKNLAQSMRMVPAYREAIVKFYHDGNTLPSDLESYNEDVQKAITDYWHFIKSIPNHINVIRARAKSQDDEEIKLFQMEKTRDRFHTIAALALLGDGVILENGQKITCDEISFEDESALDLSSYSVLGRALVSIITEENGLDIADPQREEKKTAATLDFLNGCRYSSGHWVAKGEK